ncbi:hypothetical protein DSO57_1035401 [Entomophthora muscae]|uniref:Uncharacterized protein n=1 Tax=Entomophthora muscae TaxID=34485 RepID=A0ACC2SP73_9FUNG|nr:hypothetical protein DSO57_1035401 [Entomophthora muscae]
MRIPKTPLMESLGYKWVFYIVLLLTVLASILMGLQADLDSSWCCVIPGVWYTATPLSHNPPLKEETKNYESTAQVPEPQVFCHLAFLLCYLGVYFFLGRFKPLLGRYQVFGELFHLGMVSLPVRSLVTGLNPSAIIHHLGKLLPSGWVSERVVQAHRGAGACEVQVHGEDARLVIGKVLKEFSVMQAKYKLLINHSPLLGNDNSSKPVPGYDPGHTLGTGTRNPTAWFIIVTNVSGELLIPDFLYSSWPDISDWYNGPKYIQIMYKVQFLSSVVSY